MNLRPFQSTAIDGLRAAFREGKLAPVLVSPPGSGKTVMGAACAAGHVAKGGRVSWFAHRRELCMQAAETLRRFGLEVGIFGEGASNPVQVISTQAALARGEVASCTLAVLDECHHAPADLWSTVPTALKDAGAKLLGLTGTPERADGRGLAPLFDHIVVAAQVKDLIEMGSLVPCDWQGPVRKVPKGKLATHPLKAHQRFAGDRRNVIFAPNLKAAREWMGEFNAAGIRAGMVWGSQKTDERDETMAAFRSGTLRVLLNVAIATEGTDIPEIGVVTIARSIGSTGAYLQMAGRGARTFPGKTHYTLIDLRGAAFVHGRPDDDREFSLEDLGISSGSGTGIVGDRVCKICKKAIVEDVCPHCGKDNGAEVPGDAGIEIGKWDAKREKDNSPDKRALQLAAWMRKFPGKKPGFYGFRYKAVYGHFPTGDVLAMARMLA